jgi:flagellar assembly factor FliW
MTANLMAPVIINTRTGMAAQHILTDSTYTTRTPLLKQSEA